MATAILGTGTSALGIFGLETAATLDRRITQLNTAQIDVFRLLGRAEGPGVISQPGQNFVDEGRELFNTAAAMRDTVIDGDDLTKDERVQLADRALILYEQAKIRLKQSLNEATAQEIAAVDTAVTPTGFIEKIDPKFIAAGAGILLFFGVLALRRRS